MSSDEYSDIEKRVIEFSQLLMKDRESQPDPFHILNVTRTESPYTHFLGWVLDPSAAHPWKDEFLLELLRRNEQPIPPRTDDLGFQIERYSFEKDAKDSVGFTSPDIVAHTPDRDWCMILENKFDSKEGRATAKATQCATYEERARRHFGEVPTALLFTTKTGERPLGETNFRPCSYPQIAECIKSVRMDLLKGGASSTDGTDGDRYAWYLLDSFLRHMRITFPDTDVRGLLVKLASKDKVPEIRSAVIKAHPEIRACAERIREVVPTWDSEAMRDRLRELGAGDDEIEAYDRILEWGEEHGDCEFRMAKTPSFVVRVPTSGDPVQVLCVQGRKLRFYWSHFIGSSNVYGDASNPKFARAWELAEEYCDTLNRELGWDLGFRNEKDGFREPSVALTDVANPDDLDRYLRIASEIVEKAKSTI